MITITLPIPSRLLSPNVPSHWGRKAPVVKLHRNRAKLTMLAALDGKPAPEITAYRLRFFFPTRRTRDRDNAAASCKSYQDGIADALRINDTFLIMMEPPAMEHDATNPRLEIDLWQHTPQPNQPHQADHTLSTEAESIGSSTDQQARAGSESRNTATIRKPARKSAKMTAAQLKLLFSGSKNIARAAARNTKSAKPSTKPKKGR
jgi:crossover junction endodeoxyribonuclease RusA